MVVTCAPGQSLAVSYMYMYVSEVKEDILRIWLYLLVFVALCACADTLLSIIITITFVDAVCWHRCT